MITLPRKPTPRKPKTPSKPRKPAAPKKRARKSDPTPDPLENVEYTGNIEADSAAELTALESAYRQRAKNEENRFYAATDSEYWACVCFQDREERERFMKAIGFDFDSKYITGEELAAKLGITY